MVMLVAEITLNVNILIKRPSQDWEHCSQEKTQTSSHIAIVILHGRYVTFWIFT